MPAKLNPKKPLPVVEMTPAEDDFVLVGEGEIELVLEGGSPASSAQVMLEGTVY